jgi:hypothetical protein
MIHFLSGAIVLVALECEQFDASAIRIWLGAHEPDARRFAYLRGGDAIVRA